MPFFTPHFLSHHATNGTFHSLAHIHSLFPAEQVGAESARRLVERAGCWQTKYLIAAPCLCGRDRRFNDKDRQSGTSLAVQRSSELWDNQHRDELAGDCHRLHTAAVSQVTARDHEPVSA
jgi:hypothetical protein